MDDCLHYVNKEHSYSYSNSSKKILRYENPKILSIKWSILENKMSSVTLSSFQTILSTNIDRFSIPTYLYIYGEIEMDLSYKYFRFYIDRKYTYVPAHSHKIIHYKIYLR